MICGWFKSKPKPKKMKKVNKIERDHNPTSYDVGGRYVTLTLEGHSAAFVTKVYGYVYQYISSYPDEVGKVETTSGTEAAQTFIKNLNGEMTYTDDPKNATQCVVGKVKSAAIGDSFSHTVTHNIAKMTQIEVEIEE